VFLQECDLRSSCERFHGPLAPTATIVTAATRRALSEAERSFRLGLCLRPVRGNCSVAPGFNPGTVPRAASLLLLFSPSGATERRSVAPQRGSGIRKQGWCDARLPRVENPWLHNIRALRHEQNGNRGPMNRPTPPHRVPVSAPRPPLVARRIGLTRCPPVNPVLSHARPFTAGRPRNAVKRWQLYKTLDFFCCIW
jgi:hypothetical protein